MCAGSKPLKLKFVCYDLIVCSQELLHCCCKRQKNTPINFFFVYIKPKVLTLVALYGVITKHIKSNIFTYQP